MVKSSSKLKVLIVEDSKIISFAIQCGCWHSSLTKSDRSLLDQY